ncbi:MAG: hypothetical protein EOP83_01360 [Verrucomicrobiaceae bacterium]|nr:MAG: hypothetical protein EOP83_01360 [Verrucomicrobiaceae bacterium]
MSTFSEIGSAYAAMIARNMFNERERIRIKAREEEALAAVESRVILERLEKQLSPENVEAIMMADRTIQRMEHYRIPLPGGIDELFSLAMRLETFGSYSTESEFKVLCRVTGASKLLAILEEMTACDFTFYIDKAEDGTRSFLFWYYGS